MATGGHLDVDVERRNGVAIVRLHGSAGVESADRLQEALDALAKEQFPLTILDLGHVEHIGSAGLARIVFGHLRNRHHRGEVRLAAPNATIRDVLEKTRLNALMGVYPTVEEAMQ